MRLLNILFWLLKKKDLLTSRNFRWRKPLTAWLSLKIIELEFYSVSQCFIECKGKCTVQMNVGMVGWKEWISVKFEPWVWLKVHATVGSIYRLVEIDGLVDDGRGLKEVEEWWFVYKIPRSSSSIGQSSSLAGDISSALGRSRCDRRCFEAWFHRQD